MADKKPSVKFITPKGVAIFPKLNEPDTKWKAEGEYTVRLRLEPDAIPAEIIAKVNEIRDQFVEDTKAELTAAKKGAKVKTLKVREFLTDETDKDSGDPTGFVLLKAKMTASGVSKKTGKPWSRKPKLFDAARVVLSGSKKIGGGSELKLAVEVVPYYTPKDNEVGLTAYLEAVQVIKLVQFGDKDAAGYGFGEEEGYTDEESAGGEAFKEGSAPAGTASTASSGDDF